MGKLTDCILSVYALPMNLVLRLIHPSKRIGLKSTYMMKLFSGDEYMLISSVPKRVDGIVVKGTERNFSDFAIILQGPVAEKDNFTLNSVRMYRKYYDGVRIIVSTWKDVDADTVAGIKEEGAEVILNEYPGVNPAGNLNYQLTTSLAGVRRAREMGVKYALKTRTDQRYYNPCALSMLQGIYQEGKVIFLGGIFNSFYGRPFYLSDFFAYGSIEELKILYSCDFDTDEAVKTRTEAKQKDRFKKFVEWVNRADIDCQVFVPLEYEDATITYACSEIRIAYHYFLQKKHLEKYDSMKAAYDDFLCNDVILVDADCLGFYWLKYKYQAQNPSYFQRMGKLDTAKWWELKGKTGSTGPERVL